MQRAKSSIKSCFQGISLATNRKVVIQIQENQNLDIDFSNKYAINILKPFLNVGFPSLSINFKPLVRQSPGFIHLGLILESPTCCMNVTQLSFL